MIMNHVYWQVGEVKTASKMKALHLAGGDLSKIKFYYYDEILNNKNFENEPPESFEQLAIERCIFLRNTANHLVLWLSSGYDSNTVLHYFIKSGCKIDEIVCYTRDKIFDSEYNTSLKVAISYKKTHNQKCKINWFRLQLESLEDYYQNLKDDFIYQPGQNLRFSKTDPTSQLHSHYEIRKFLEVNANTRLDIFGTEKPKLLIEEGKWYTAMPDNNFYYFYSDAITSFFNDAPYFKIFAKQAHMALKWFESLPEFDEALLSKVQSYDQEYYNRWNVACGRVPVINKFSVNGWSKHLYFNDYITSIDSLPYVQFYQNSKIMKYYKTAINDFKSFFKLNDLKNLPNLQIMGLKKFLKNVKK